VYAISRDDWPGLLEALPGEVRDYLRVSAPQIKKLFAAIYTRRNPELVARRRARVPEGTFDLLTTRQEGENYSLGERIDRALLPRHHHRMRAMT
jgi:hypothetical protein